MVLKPFEKLLIAPQRRFSSKDKEQHKREPSSCNGWDTETFEGRCHLIAVSNANKDTLHHYVPLYPEDEAQEAYRLFNFIIESTHTGGIKPTINYFFNLDYDVRAILRWIPSELWYDFSKGRQIEFLGFKFSYLPSKKFVIRKGKFSISFYDMQQFYGNSLNYNAQKYLNMAKIEGIDRRDIGTLPAVWIHRRDEILEYCLMDCEILAKLGDFFNTMLYKTLNFSTNKFYSTGSLAQEYYLTQTHIPQTYKIPVDVLKMHWDSYRGGRVELLQRGTFPKLYEMDIKSAYPAHMADLLDYADGDWDNVKNGETSAEVEAGIYRINLSWNYPKIAPFPCHLGNSGTLYYPIQAINRYNEYIINEQELAFLNAHPDKCDFEVLEGREFYSMHGHKPFKEIINRVFELKETTDDAMKRLLYKLILNSAYGKTAQAIEIDEAPEKLYRTGTLWNPVYASRITSLTRLQLIKAALPMIDNVVGLATDAIHTTRRPSVPRAGKLGSFELSGKGEEALVLMAGVRQIGNIVKGRGFSIPKDVSLIDIARAHPGKKEFPVYFERPLGIFRSLQSRRHQEMNSFVSERKMINVNGDTRRYWLNEFANVEEALTSNMTSFALPSQ